jgi:hypothetical protein
MLLKDLGEILHSVDVMDFFGYRCPACGHKKMTTPSQCEDLEKIPIENRLMERTAYNGRRNFLILRDDIGCDAQTLMTKS